MNRGLISCEYGEYGGKGNRIFRVKKKAYLKMTNLCCIEYVITFVYLVYSICDYVTVLLDILNHLPVFDTCNFPLKGFAIIGLLVFSCCCNSHQSANCHTLFIVDKCLIDWQ